MIESPSDSPSLDISTEAEGPLSLLCTTLQASAGSIIPHSITSHLRPLLNSSLYVLAHMWGVDGRISQTFRKFHGRPLLKRCLGIMAAVAEGEQAGQCMDGPKSPRQIWGTIDYISVAPSMAVDVLCALHVLVQDEQRISEGGPCCIF